MLIVSGDIPEAGYNGISDKFHKFNYTSESCTPWQGVFTLIFHFLQRQSIPWGHTVSFYPWLLSVVWIIFLFIFRCPLAWMKREPGANPGWARRCNRGRIPQYNHCSLEDGKVWMECDPRVRRPTWRSVRVLRKRSEQYVHIWEKNGISQVNYLIGLGFFFSRPWKNGGCYEVEVIFFRSCRYVLVCFNK